MYIICNLMCVCVCVCVCVCFIIIIIKFYQFAYMAETGLNAILEVSNGK